MENCLIIINKSAGTANKISFDSVKKRLGNAFKYTCHTIPNDGEPNVDAYDALAVCGGDGTLSNVLDKVYNKEKRVFYFPAGTLNDKAKSKANAMSEPHAIVGVVSGSTNTVFSYVFAAGSFTPIGYTASIQLKKRLGVLAYLFEVIKEYRIHRINANIVLDDDKKYADEYTLVMLVKSPRCFGFKFNRAYDEESESGHIVLIRAPKHDGLIGKIEMFFPFFRVFFMGLKKEKDGKIVFKEFECAEIKLGSKTNFCKDGEKETVDGQFSVRFAKTKCNLNLMNKN